MTAGMFDDGGGLMRLTLDLAAAPLRVQNRAVRTTRRAITAVEADGKAHAPVDTGTLRASISSDTTIVRNEIIGEAGPTVDYGLYVERGTSRMAGQPYMRPALDAQAGPYQQALGEDTEHIL